MRQVSAAAKCCLFRLRLVGGNNQNPTNRIYVMNHTSLIFFTWDNGLQETIHYYQPSARFFFGCCAWCWDFLWNNTVFVFYCHFSKFIWNAVDITFKFRHVIVSSMRLVLVYKFNKTLYVSEQHYRTRPFCRVQDTRQINNHKKLFGSNLHVLWMWGLNP